jgi:peptide/nickel transport system ATP-binding protein
MKPFRDPNPSITADETNALEIDSLCVSYRVGLRRRQIISNLSITVPKGRTFGLVGESGCGKSTAALAVARYLPNNGTIDTGTVKVGGEDIYRLRGRALRDWRAREFAMVYQDPGRALNPTYTVGNQLEEVFRVAGNTHADAHSMALDMLARVRITLPERVYGQYPHELSGGMQQRVVIAMALAVSRKLIILDEPTTGLDATVEAEILDLIEDLRAEHDTSILMIGHNLSVIARVCDRVGVLYAGTLVEEGDTREVFGNPRHPYTESLLRCVPTFDQSKRTSRLQTIPGYLPASPADLTGCVFAERCGLSADICRYQAPELITLGNRKSRCHFSERTQMLPITKPTAVTIARPINGSVRLLELLGVSKTFGHGKAAQTALDGITLHLNDGETLGLVGESGSGKSTLSKILLGLMEPDPGSKLLFDGQVMSSTVERRGKSLVRDIQMVFQNPDSALNRSHSIARILLRPLEILGAKSRRQALDLVGALMRSVRLTDNYLTAKPRQLSGGLKQRLAIARAFAGDPRLVVCDEPTSALDVSVQAAILNLLVDLQSEKGVAYLFISHDLKVVRYLSDRIAVLYRGRLVEIGPASNVFEGPHHPYTETLLAASSDSGPKTGGSLDRSPTSVNTGCNFASLCRHRITGLCDSTIPALRNIGGGHEIACHLTLEGMPRAKTKRELEVVN